MEIGILVVMGSHCYEFGGKLFLQVRGGGPMGLAITAWIASITMKCYDSLWISFLNANGLDFLKYLPYVDVSHTFLKALGKGVRWVDSKFQFNPIWQLEDIEENNPNDSRNVNLLLEAKNSVMDFLKFTGEAPSDYPDK